MCGICGVLSLDRDVPPRAVLDSMTAAITHRGPDETGSWIGEGIGLGHTRLKIIDLSSAAHQPMANEDGTLRIVFNGEIYNYRELRRKLAAGGHPFLSQSDTEVILHLYEETGDRCVEDLDGMFAFALWDGRARRLLLARDRFGKKPLYYYLDQRMLGFASEIKALLRHPAIPQEVNTAALPLYFLYGYVPTPETVYCRILSLPPGHTLTIAPEGGRTLRHYWELAFGERDDQRDPEVASDRRVAVRIRELLTEAVRKRLVADVPIGAFLSGGIDSSIVVGLMSQLLREPVRTFSIGFEGDPFFDETRYALEVSRHLRTDHTEFKVKPKAIELIETLVRQYDGPFGDSSAIPTYILAGLTRERSTVALNGDGGDELFAGYPRFAAATLAEWIPAGLARWGGRLLSLIPEPRNYWSPLRKAQRFFRAAAIPFYGRYSKWISLFYDDVELLLRPELLDKIGAIDRIAYFRDHLDKVARYSPLNRLLYLNIKTYLLDDLLVKMDRMTMAHGLETRSPFLDVALMEYTSRLPDRMRLRRGITKYILRRAFEDLLPRRVLTRGKMGFGVPLGAWFRGELRDYLRELLLAPDARIRDYLDQSYVAAIVDDHLARRLDHGHRLWAILTFEVWLRLGTSRAAGAAEGSPGPLVVSGGVRPALGRR
jgi:asparagine synthase (glutamine-hydrolysing)